MITNIDVTFGGFLRISDEIVVKVIALTDKGVHLGTFAPKKSIWRQEIYEKNKIRDRMT